MLKKVIIWFVASFFLIQLIQVDVVESKEIDLNLEIQAPKEIMTVLESSCYDCHSYKTKMPWYGHIAPFSWEIRGNINGGRKWLNFQEWENYDEDKKQKLYQKIYESVGFRMPISIYVSMHSDAELTKEKKAVIEEWAKSYIREQD